jgi:hypothetical protein
MVSEEILKKAVECNNVLKKCTVYLLYFLLIRSVAAQSNHLHVCHAVHLLTKCRELKCTVLRSNTTLELSLVTMYGTTTRRHSRLHPPVWD